MRPVVQRRGWCTFTLLHHTQNRSEQTTPVASADRRCVEARYIAVQVQRVRRLDALAKELSEAVEIDPLFRDYEIGALAVAGHTDPVAHVF